MITLIKKTDELIDRRKTDERVGFVPTMGNLHPGHISLLEEAFQHFDTVYFSIFVNPKQFGPSEDFNRYPRTLENDLKHIEILLEKYPSKSVVVFAPETPQEIYPQDYNQVVSVEGLNKILEGAFRPDHFDGVTTVVYRLFEIVRPSESYFGLKDYQQYVIIKKMVKDLALPIKVVGMPIVREQSGLALSSRNQYLSEVEKGRSLILNHSLKKVVAVLDGKKANIPNAHRMIQELTQDLNWNYLEMRDSEDLSSDISNSKNITILGVYQLGATRLLDNMQVEMQ